MKTNATNDFMKHSRKTASAKPLIEIGQQMSNICFNLSQDQTIGERHRRSMKECQRQWDDARQRFEAHAK